MTSRILALVTAGGLLAASIPGSGPALASAVRPVTPGTVGAVAPDTAAHWGEFFGDGRRSDADPVKRPTAVQLPAPVSEIGTSNSTQYALLDNGTVWAWGQGASGQLGDGSTANSFTSAVQVQFPPGVRIAFLATDAMPYDGALAVDTSGNAWAWGRNPGGEFCLGSTGTRIYTRPTELPFTSVTTLAGADEHAVFDGVYHGKAHIWSCGENYDGVLGDGSGNPSPTPVAVKHLAAGQVTDLVSAQDDAGALLANGQYYDWGRNAAGQLGDGTTAKSLTPVQVSLPDPVTKVAQGGSSPDNGQTLALLSDGVIEAWGNNTWGQLGNGGTTEERRPVRVDAPDGVRYTTLISGGATSYAITSDGDVYAWGAGGKWQIGDGQKTLAQLVPVDVESGAAVGSATAYDVAVAGSLGFQPAARPARVRAR